IAGSPGSLVLYSPDGGQSWISQQTPSTTPIRKLTFVDEQHGWAVGSLGKILRTTNGGNTWQVVRNDQARLAALAFFADAGDVPWETLAKIAFSDGYRTSCTLLSANDISPDPAWS